MTKVTVDLNVFRNNLNQLNAEASTALHAKSDLERRDILLRLVEKIKTLKSNLDANNVLVEVK